MNELDKSAPRLVEILEHLLLLLESIQSCSLRVVVTKSFAQVMGLVHAQHQQVSFSQFGLGGRDQGPTRFAFVNEFPLTILTSLSALLVLLRRHTYLDVFFGYVLVCCSFLLHFSEAGQSVIPFNF